MNTEVDVLVAGSGAAGLAAAVTAALDGCETMIVEKSSFLGGTTAWSGGGLWIPDNMHMHSAGIADSREQALLYLSNLLGNQLDRQRMENYLDRGPEMMRFLEDNTRSVRFFSVTAMTDYEPSVEGATFGRAVTMPPYNASELGNYFKILRPPLEQLTVLGGMQIDGNDVHHLIERWRSRASLMHSAKLVLRHAIDRLRSPRGRLLKSGNAVVARLVRAAVDHGVVLEVNAGMQRLIEENGRVVGAVILSGGQEIKVRARKGVILATGGFASNPELMARLMPFPEQHQTMLPSSNTGDGIRMGLQIGAGMGPELENNAIWSPISVLRQEDGTTICYPHIFLDRSRPGSIVVNREGRRFVDEATTYHAFVAAMHQTGSVPAWLIANKKFVKKYGLGLVRPYERTARYINAGYLIEGSADELSRKLGIDAEALKDTIARVDRDAVRGVDTEFGRGGNIYDVTYGDPNHKPNPNLGVLGDGPYYAVELLPGDLGTSVGLKADEHARVLRDGSPIPGLYTAGLDMQSIMGGKYPGAGCMIGPAMTFGYIAARDAAGKSAPYGVPAISVVGSPEV